MAAFAVKALQLAAASGSWAEVELLRRAAAQALPRMLRIVTLNLWFNGRALEERTRAQLELFEAMDPQPDIIFLQVSHGWWNRGVSMGDGRWGGVFFGTLCLFPATCTQHAGKCNLNSGGGGQHTPSD